MKLILLYGPPAVGKLTVAKELANLTGITLYHSHMILNDIVEIFGYDNPVRRKLEFEFKLRIVEEAADQDKSLILTAAPVGPNIEYYKKLIQEVEKRGGEVCIVRMTADKEELFNRVAHESRNQKIHDREKLQKFWEEFPENLGEFFGGKQLIIDNTNISPAEAAQKIAAHFKL